MLNSETALHAIRIMGVDTANLMTQLAVYRATIEELIEATSMVDQRSWEPVTAQSEDEGGETIRTVTQVMVPPDQHQALLRILYLIDGLR